MHQNKMTKVKKEILAFARVTLFYSIFILIISENQEEFWEKLKDVIEILFLFRFGVGMVVWIGKSMIYRMNRWIEGKMSGMIKYKWEERSLYKNLEEQKNYKIFEETLESMSVPMVVLRDIIFEKDIADYILITRKFVHVVNLQGLEGEIRVSGEEFFSQREEKEFKSPILTNKQILDVMKKQMQKNYKNPIKKLFKTILFEKEYSASAIICDYKTILDIREARKDIKKKLHRIEEFEELLLYTLELKGCLTYRDQDMFKIADRILGWSQQSCVAIN